MRFVPPVAVLVALAACGSTTPPEVTPDAGATGDASAGGDASSSSGERTLASCETQIATDAPEIFRAYFRCVTIETTADAIVISSRALPPHKSNYWGQGSPNYAPFDTSRGAEYRANPNTLEERAFKLTIPKTPTSRGLTVTAALIDGQVGSSQLEYPLGVAGVALDSVAIFNPLARPGDDIEAEKFTFDDYNAHPAPEGTYHYHTASKGPLEVLVAGGLAAQASPGGGDVELFGVMCDGTFVLGCTELDGSAPGGGALDAQGGHVHDLTNKTGTVLVADRYHVHVCPSGGGRKFTPEIQYYSACSR